MLFKDIKQNNPVYVLDKQEFKVSHTKAVKDAGYPYRDPKAMPSTAFSQSNMVVDVTVELGEKTPTFTIPENLSVAYAGDLVISTTAEPIIKEVEAMQAEAKRALSPEVQEHNKKIVDSADKLLSELSPAHKEKAEAEKRMGLLENSVGDLKTEMRDMKKMLSDFIGEFKK